VGGKASSGPRNVHLCLIGFALLLCRVQKQMYVLSKRRHDGAAHFFDLDLVFLTQHTSPGSDLRMHACLA